MTNSKYLIYRLVNQYIKLEPNVGIRYNDSKKFILFFLVWQDLDSDQILKKVGNSEKYFISAKVKKWF